MKKLQLLFLGIFLTTIAFCDEKQDSRLTDEGLLTSIDSEPSAIVDGCVNVISGEFVDCHTDLILPAPDPVRVRRVLTNNNPHPFIRRHNPSPKWAFDQVGKIVFQKDATAHHDYLACYEGSMGEYLLFKLDTHTISQARVPNSFIKRGCTNTSKGIISAKTNVRNTLITWKQSKKKCKIETGDGTCLQFIHHRKHKEDYDYYINKEIRPDTLISTFGFDKKFNLENYQLKNHFQQVLASYQIHSENIGDKEKPNIMTYVAGEGDGRKVRYIFEPYRVTGKGSVTSDDLCLKEVYSDQGPKISYKYSPGKRYKHQFNEWSKIKQKSLPNNRYVRIKYQMVEKNIDIRATFSTM